MRGIRAKLVFSFAKFKLRELHKQAGCYISPSHHVADTKLQILVPFSSNFLGIIMLC